MRRIISVLFLLLGAVAYGQRTDGKMNGISLVSEKEYLQEDQISQMKQLNANWVSVIPFAFVPDKHKPELIFDIDGQWRGERVYGIHKAVRSLHENGFQVMMKPQLWVGDKEYSGHIKMKTEEDWLLFEEEYRRYIMAFVRIAEEEKVELLCIGTELSKFVRQRPLYWEQLIYEIRSMYAGEITYAANWDSYKFVSFWGDLDYIGIDAYFPITKKNNPSYFQLKKGWLNLEIELHDFSSLQDRPILFTEYGYRSVLNCTDQPWEYGDSGVADEKAQVKALKALYEIMWEKNYFAGGFLWKWFPDHENAGGAGDNAYTVQNKLAEKLVQEKYSGK